MQRRRQGRGLSSFSDTDVYTYGEQEIAGKRHGSTRDGAITKCAHPADDRNHRTGLALGRRPRLLLDGDRQGRTHASGVPNIVDPFGRRMVVEEDDDAVVFILTEDIVCRDDALAGRNTFVPIDPNLHGVPRPFRRYQVTGNSKTPYTELSCLK